LELLAEWWTDNGWIFMHLQTSQPRTYAIIILSRLLSHAAVLSAISL